MSVRTKILLIFIPLSFVGLSVTGAISGMATVSGLTQAGIRTMSFKATQLQQNIQESWSLLRENQVELNPEYLDAFIRGVILYAATLTQSDTENIVILDKNHQHVASTRSDVISEQEIDILMKLIEEGTGEQTKKNSRWISQSFDVAGISRVGYYFYSAPLDWSLFITETRSVFFAPVISIATVTLIVLVISLVITIVITVLFANTILAPIRQLMRSMQNIIRTNHFSERVDVLYKDEVGTLSHTFNVMIAELEDAYKQIKQYAFRAMLSKRQENKIRNIFQKYVPNSIINELFKNPAEMFRGENKKIAIMFTDIRSFTTISEQYRPDELVAHLNNYFEKMVDIIANNNGVVDKYIGDAIMAFFGAPSPLENSSLAAIKTALEMEKAISTINKNFSKEKKPQFITGMGINFGEVTVGNIGSEKKMDYTVIGDAVNLGSRLEGLTKQYKTNLIFSESVYENICRSIPCRIVDAVRVKGKTTGQRIYTTTPSFSSTLIDVYALHNRATEFYFARDFKKALSLFRKVSSISSDRDSLSQMYIQRCQRYIQHPPDKKWDGVFVMSTK